MSQQQIVWSENIAAGGRRFTGTLERPTREEEAPAFGRRGPANPESWDAYYRDLAVLAFPVPEDWGETNSNRHADVTSNLPVSDYQRLTDISNTEITVETDQEGWIQFAFDEPFTLRSVRINPGGGGFGGAFNRPAHSMEVQASDDGVAFQHIGALEPMANSWQTRVSYLVHTVPQTTARFFRLVYNPGPPIGYDEHMQGGSYRGAGGGWWQQEEPEEDVPDMLDTVDRLALCAVELSSTAVVHHYQGKTALAWGLSRRISDEEMPASACVPLNSIIDLTSKLNDDGTLDDWQPPAGTWKILRFGYTTMARTNGSGIGQGLEADKFSADGARIAFEGWYGKVLKRIGPRLSGNVLKMLNVDSWECGSQNWSPVFRDEFKARRGFDVLEYLPAMAGIPVQSADVTESFLFDIRRTIAELICDNFFGTLKKLAHAHGSLIQTEAVCPTMTADGMLVHKNVDVTAGEFWVTAWQNWKPCDIRDAVSGAHIYGKKIAMAEAFTGGGDWSEHPYDLKAMGDLHFADGINRFMLHLWAAQPYPGRVPGVTGAAGTYFNEHNTWWKPGEAWIDYLRRCQSLLQTGRSVADALYFTGEEVPGRALIPPRYGTYYVTNPPLPEGYDYDSINQDALLNLTGVNDGNIVLNSGVSYRILVLRPDTLITPQVAHKIKELVYAGATVVGPKPTGSTSLEMGDTADAEVIRVAEEVWGNMDGVSITENVFGKGRVFWGKPMDEVLTLVEADPDALFTHLLETETGKSYQATAFEPHGVNPTLVGAERQGWGMVWIHKQDIAHDFYFLSNQEQVALSTEVSLRISGKVPELWHPDTGNIEAAPLWREENGRTIIPMAFDPAGSVFVMFRKAAVDTDHIVEITGDDSAGPRRLKLEVTDAGLTCWAAKTGSWNLKTETGRIFTVRVTDVPDVVEVQGAWDVAFPLLHKPDKQIRLQPGSWTDNSDDDIKYFSGTASYLKTFTLPESNFTDSFRLFLDLGEIKNLARVRLNGKDLGVLWKPPYRVEVTSVAEAGANRLEIEVTNTWKNHLIRDAGLPEAERTTWIAGGGPRANTPLLPAGLLGPVRIITAVGVKPDEG